VDYDPQALEATQQNAEENGVAAHITTGLPEQLPSLSAHVLLANILAQPLIQLAPRFAGMIQAGGHIVLSGILAEQAHEVLAAYQPWFDMEAPVEREGWVRLTGRRKH
jgi:ribosomal protein L11 methyltransferase